MSQVKTADYLLQAFMEDFIHVFHEEEFEEAYDFDLYFTMFMSRWHFVRTHEDFSESTHQKLVDFIKEFNQFDTKLGRPLKEEDILNLSSNPEWKLLQSKSRNFE